MPPLAALRSPLRKKKRKHADVLWSVSSSDSEDDDADNARAWLGVARRRDAVRRALSSGRVTLDLGGRLRHPRDEGRPGDSTHRIPLDLYKELVDDECDEDSTWLARAEAMLELLSSTANRQVMQDMRTRLAAVVPVAQRERWERKRLRLSAKMEALPLGRRCGEWCALQQERVEVDAAIAREDARVDAARARLYDEWRVTCARLCAQQAARRNAQSRLEAYFAHA